MKKIIGIILILVILIGVGFVGINALKEVSTCEKCQLIEVALALGATDIEVTEGSVSFLLNERYVTYYKL